MFFMSAADCWPVRPLFLPAMAESVVVEAVIGRSGKAVKGPESLPLGMVGLCGAGDGAGLGGCAIAEAPLEAEVPISSVKRSGIVTT
jgi:hypothetical protein